MSEKKDFERLGDFNEKLSVYINLYMDTPNYDEEKLESLEEMQKEIDSKLGALLSKGFAGWTADSEALHQELQGKNQEINEFIEDISRLKKKISNTAAALGLIDKALELAAGIAAKCAAA
jgi:peptidoglycan hydrolase CwlO-like protein